MAAVTGALLRRRNTQIQETIKFEFSQAAGIAPSQREWAERAVADLLAPAHLQLDRTEGAFQHYRVRDVYVEQMVIREGNFAIQDLQLTRAQLLPPILREDAGRLVDHYGRWLEGFDRLRRPGASDLDAPFVFVGRKAIRFLGRPLIGRRKRSDRFGRTLRDKYAVDRVRRQGGTDLIERFGAPRQVGPACRAVATSLLRIVVG